MASFTANVSEIFASVQGEGAHVGRRHLFVRFGGCPLRCRYCDTPESLVATPSCRIIWEDQDCEFRENPFDVAALDALVTARAEREAHLDALALTGGEPLVQAGFLAAWLPTRRLRVPVLLETAATLPAQLEKIVSFVDIVSADIKLPSSSGEPACWAEHEACLRLSAGRDVYVKMVVDETTDPDEVERGARLVASVNPDIPVFLQPATGVGDERLRISAATLDRFYRRAVRAGIGVRIVPQIHKILGVP
jgi:organic radical activating enzyme